MTYDPIPDNISHICSMPNDLCDSLLVWLSTFDVVNHVSYSPVELTDGLVLASVLTEVCKLSVLSFSTFLRGS